MAVLQTRVCVNLVQMREAHLANLQRLKDVLFACHAGLAGLNGEDYANHHHIFEIDPLTSAKLNSEQASSCARSWLTKTFVQDVIDLTNSFVERCYESCLWLDAHGKPRQETLEQSIAAAVKRFHREGLPNKLEILKARFQITTEFSDYLISLNDARACFVHRLGKVTQTDVNNGDVLRVQLWAARIIAVDGSGNEEVVTPPYYVRHDVKTFMRNESVDKVFQVGEMIEFDLSDVYACVFTWFVFSEAMIVSIGQFGISRGIQPIVRRRPDLQIGFELEAPEKDPS